MPVSLDKNINVDASNCRSCKHIADVTISPTLFTDREVTYKVHAHDLSNISNAIVDSEELDDKIKKAVQEAIFVGEELPESGEENNIYIDADDKKTLVWDEETQEYIVVSNYAEDVTDEDIENLFK